MLQFNRTLCAGTLAVALLGCSREQKPQTFVARVGGALLTEEDLAAVRDSAPENTNQMKQFVNDWITSELLFQEAARQGLAESPELRKELESIRKRLVIESLLDNVLYAEDTSAVNEDAIVTMYNAGPQAFLLREDVLNLSYALFSDRDAANAFRSNILRGSSSWNNAIVAVQQDSVSQPQLLMTATRQYFTRASVYPEELWKLARSLSKDDVSFVLKTDAGYYVVVTHGVKQAGEMPELDFIRNEIHDRLLIEHRRLSYERLVADLRAKNRVEVHMNFPDTSTASQELPQ